MLDSDELKLPESTAICRVDLSPRVLDDRSCADVATDSFATGSVWNLFIIADRVTRALNDRSRADVAADLSETASVWDLFVQAMKHAVYARPEEATDNQALRALVRRGTTMTDLIKAAPEILGVKAPPADVARLYDMLRSVTGRACNIKPDAPAYNPTRVKWQEAQANLGAYLNETLGLC